MRVAPDDPALHPIGGDRDAGDPLRRVPVIQDVREMGVTGTRDQREDPLVAGRDDLEKLLLVCHQRRRPIRERTIVDVTPRRTR